ncbi:MAG: hypothetical protein GY751_02875 [Bacteroidetes bacterium]|nr:hypothetical protein [Bacteroidota bacterium]
MCPTNFQYFRIRYHKQEYKNHTSCITYLKQKLCFA